MIILHLFEFQKIPTINFNWILILFDCRFWTVAEQPNPFHPFPWPQCLVISIPSGQSWDPVSVLKCRPNSRPRAKSRPSSRSSTRLNDRRRRRRRLSHFAFQLLANCCWQDYDDDGDADWILFPANALRLFEVESLGYVHKIAAIFFSLIISSVMSRILIAHRLAKKCRFKKCPCNAIQFWELGIDTAIEFPHGWIQLSFFGSRALHIEYEIAQTFHTLFASCLIATIRGGARRPCCIACVANQSNTQNPLDPRRNGEKSISK